MTTIVSMSLRNARVMAAGVRAPLGAVAKFAVQPHRAAAIPAAQTSASDARNGEKVLMRASIRCGPLWSDRFLTLRAQAQLKPEEAGASDQNCHNALTISASGSPNCELMRSYSPRKIRPNGNFDCTPAPYAKRVLVT